MLKCRPYGKETEPETEYTGELPAQDEIQYIQTLLLQARGQYTTYTSLLDQILNVLLCDILKI